MIRWMRVAPIPVLLLGVGCADTPVATSVADAELGRGHGNYPVDTIAVPIDIKPEAVGDGGINLQDQNPVAVALLVNDAIDVAAVVPNTVRFGVPALEEFVALEPIHDLMRPSAFTSHLKYAEDGETLVYLVFHFDPATLPLGVVELCLTGMTKDGTAFRGCESVEVRE